MNAEPEITRALVCAVRAIRWEDVPADAREAARHCLLDFLGVALAGAHEPATEIVVGAVVRGEEAGEASLIGRAERTSRLSAALVNGTAGHALDFDDTHTRMSGHPSVPVLPALLALAETTAASGRQLLEALVAGIELECRLAVLLGPRHYAIGFHSTGTLGTFGAAAACAHLLGLDEQRSRHAVGLAGAQAAGLKSSFGTMAKPLQAGRAASAGLLAALLAQGGFTANPAVIEAPQGFAATHAGAAPPAALVAPAAGRFCVCDTLFKYHAACYLTHAAIEAAAALRAAHGLAPEEISRVEIRVSPTLLDVCAIAEPRTGLEGKFSLRATTAMALHGDETGDPGVFTDARILDPRLVALRDRVHVAAVDGTSPTRAVVIVDARGRRLEAENDTGVPATDLAAQRARLERKFMLLAAGVLGRPAAARLAETALTADELPAAGTLMQLARPFGRADRL